MELFFVYESDLPDGVGFELFHTEEVENLLRFAPIETLDVWLYAFYSEYPDEMINHAVLVNMYEYFEKDYDKQTHHSGMRRLGFLQKYEEEDPCAGG